MVASNQTNSAVSQMRRIARIVAKNPKKFLFGYLALSTWPFYALRCEVNEPFQITFKYLAAPILILCWWFGLRYRDEFMSVRRRKSAFWIGLVCISLLAVLWSTGFVMQANAFLPPQTEFWLDGEVSAKCVDRGRYSKNWIVDVRTPEGVRRIEVSPQEYAALSVGGRFHQKRWLGPLGFSYVWK